MANTIKNLALLIATKDRPVELRNLLISVKNSSRVPEEIIIVYAGENVSYLKDEFQKELKIRFIVSQIASQNFQKYVGIKLLIPNYTWILFMDDDLLLKPDSLKILYENYLSNENYRQYIGFGLGISNIYGRKFGEKEKKLLKLFKLYSDKPGDVTSSGHAQSYLQQSDEIEVSWLNGLSVWHSKVLSEYPFEETTKPYSAYEDVIFSYSVSNYGKLLFVPKVSLMAQKPSHDEPLSVQQFVYGGYLRFQFVNSHRELSKNWLLVAQIFRNIHFVFRGDHNLTYRRRFVVATNLWWNIVFLIIRRRDVVDMWKYKVNKF